MKLRYHFVFILGIIGLIVFIGYFFYINMPVKNEFGESICGDGTVYEECSSRKPYYCSDGLLFERASICGCPDGLNQKGDLCLLEKNYLTNLSRVTLEYTIRGNNEEISYDVYKDAADYVSNIQRIIISSNGESSSRRDFKLKSVNEKKQDYFLEPLVVKIQNMEDNEVEQARIAISVVQNIDYGFSDRVTRFGGFVLNYSRYPYEVLYENEGVCGEKSQLLAYLLKELGYGVAIFYNQPENHESIGIKCPVEESWHNSGYCFIETSGPAIISDSEIEYVGGVELDSIPQVLVISEGKSLPENLYEYEDAEDFIELRDKFTNDGINIFERYKYRNLKEKYGLVDVYNLI